jgi:SAM-dependent methyltransferase
MDAAPVSASSAASAWVARWAPLVPAGEVLDLACGSGRHARLFAALGHPVLALDRDPAALEAATQPVGWTGSPSTRSSGGGGPAERVSASSQPVERVGGRPAHPTGESVVSGALAGPIVPMRHDLEAEGAAWPFAPGRFAGIVVTNYLHRPLMAQLLRSLAPGGVLIYETFALGNEAFGKPSNPAFLLAPGELLEHAAEAGLRAVAYEDGFVAHPKPALVQRLCAAGPAFAPGDARLDQLSGRNEP